MMLVIEEGGGGGGVLYWNDNNSDHPRYWNVQGKDVKEMEQNTKVYKDVACCLEQP